MCLVVKVEDLHLINKCLFLPITISTTNKLCSYILSWHCLFAPPMVKSWLRPWYLVGPSLHVGPTGMHPRTHVGLADPPSSDMRGPQALTCRVQTLAGWAHQALTCGTHVPSSNTRGPPSKAGMPGSPIYDIWAH
jgi:hypothetical protein